MNRLPNVGDLISIEEDNYILYITKRKKKSIFYVFDFIQIYNSSIKKIKESYFSGKEIRFYIEKNIWKVHYKK